MKGKDKTSKSRAGRRARRQLSLRLLAKALAQRDIEKQNKETIRRQKCGRIRDETVRITNMPEDTEEVEILELVGEFGHVKGIYMVRNPSGVFVGNVYVFFADIKDAQRAIDVLDGFRYDHMILYVSWAPSINSPH
ncbi:hypothetical protein M9434_000256 [Picochlorum sp. BPE23]|nr:hypothetical protein M9434_000256 [Picochlorum sp. BPE23]KAI8106286.1 hypothetical protein M9435_000832 [Picochlorum sp. BPE23]